MGEFCDLLDHIPAASAGSASPRNIPDLKLLLWWLFARDPALSRSLARFLSFPAEELTENQISLLGGI